jgi:hypothetical protein
MKAPTSEKLWRTIRALRTFTFHDLEIITAISMPAVRTYVSLLKAGGYLRVTPLKNHRGARNIYVLIKDTGAKVPTVRTCLYDPNTGEFIKAGMKS